MAVIRWARHPHVAAEDWSRRWLQIQADLGLAQNTVDAYGRGLEEFLCFVKSMEASVLEINRERIAAYIRFLRTKPGHENRNVVTIDSMSHLSNATLQQRLTVVRLFYDFLMEEQQCDRNPVGRGRYTPGKAFGGDTQRGLIPRVRKLPWIPDESAWERLVEIVACKPIRTRLMFAMSYDGHCDVRSFAFLRRRMSIRPGSWLEFVQKPRRTDLSAWCPTRRQQVLCIGLTSTIEGV